MFWEFLLKDIPLIGETNLLALSICCLILFIIMTSLFYFSLEFKNKKIKLFLSILEGVIFVSSVVGFSYLCKYNDILSDYKVVSEKYNISREEFFKAYFDERERNLKEIERKKSERVAEQARLDKIEKSSEVSAARRIANKYGIR